ncbi:sugar ABC transporter permease [Isoptericola halotolerans]|uniref:carbohydrate ABC transporter permease n=1 Tax=Isoptericola halotolerans TaxID=300560 RepID=UPI00388DDAAA
MTSTPADVGSRGAPRGAAGTTPAAPPGGRRRRTLSSSQWAAVGFAAPLLVYLVLFYAYPLWRNIDLSVHDYTIRAFVQGDAEFVGLQNYVDVFSSSTFPTALRNTFVFMFGSIAFQFTIGLALAVFFRSSFRLSSTLRAMFLVPWLLPLIVSASTWAWMLNSENGIVNSVITAFGGEQINWLTSPDTALLSVTIANIWLGIPFNLVILYSGREHDRPACRGGAELGRRDLCLRDLAGRLPAALAVGADRRPDHRLAARGTGRGRAGAPGVGRLDGVHRG